MIKLSSPSLFGGILVQMNALGTSKTMISSPLYKSIVAIEISSGDSVGLEVPPLENRYLVGFQFNTISPLIFFVELFLSSINIPP